MMPQPRRKKWAEAEERTLIEKYGEMICDGSLCKMKTREKKYRPIALYVNSVHHARDPVTYPWQWTWKDVSTKVQNMRHQYALVKQKIKRQECSVRGSAEEEYDWMEGITHWSNFLRYKEVFGDVPLALVASGGVARGSECTGGFEGGDHELDILQFDPMVPVGEADFVVENGVVDVGFNYDAGYSGGGNKSMVSAKEGFVCEDIEPSPSDLRKKKKGLKVSERKTWAFVANQLNHLRKLEIHLEQRDAEREREMQRRENHQIEMEKEHQKKLEGMEKEREIRRNTREKVRRQLLEEWQTIERENEEREKGRREEEIKHEIELEERLKRRRLEWKKRMNEMVSQHREEMSQLQARVLHDQQTIANQFLGLVSQWAGHPSGISDHAAASSHYLPQNLDHVHGDAREDGNNQEDQFIVDG